MRAKLLLLIWVSLLNYYLIERLIVLFKPDIQPIEFKTTGLSPGEKLHEDIIDSNEKLIPTANNNVFMVEKKRNTNKD